MWMGTTKMVLHLHCLNRCTPLCFTVLFVDEKYQSAATPHKNTLMLISQKVVEYHLPLINESLRQLSGAVIVGTVPQQSHQNQNPLVYDASYVGGTRSISHVMDQDGYQSSTVHDAGVLDQRHVHVAFGKPPAKVGP
jgi:hypothetical protein